MSSTYFSLSDAKEAVTSHHKSLARGYFWENRTEQYLPDEYMDLSEISGAGAIISNVLDYSKYLRAMIGEAPPISSTGHSSLREPRSFMILGPSISHPGLDTITYSLGWSLGNYRGQKIIFHEGGLIGFGSLMLYMPGRQWGVAMMANTRGTSNLAEEILLYALIDDLLETPVEQRPDMKGNVDRQNRDEEEKLKAGLERLYPDRPKRTIPLSFPLEDYTGTYINAGYQSIELTLVTPNSQFPFAAESKKILHVDAFDRTWAQELHFQHVSGEYFLVFASRPKSNEYLSIEGLLKGEFRLDPSGKVAKLGLGVEEMMRGDKIWFKKMM